MFVLSTLLLTEFLIKEFYYYYYYYYYSWPIVEPIRESEKVSMTDYESTT